MCTKLYTTNIDVLCIYAVTVAFVASTNDNNNDESKSFCPISLLSYDLVVLLYLCVRFILVFSVCSSVHEHFIANRIIITL